MGGRFGEGRQETKKDQRRQSTTTHSRALYLIVLSAPVLPLPNGKRSRGCRCSRRKSLGSSGPPVAERCRAVMRRILGGGWAPDFPSRGEWVTPEAEPILIEASQQFCQCCLAEQRQCRYHLDNQQREQQRARTKSIAYFSLQTRRLSTPRARQEGYCGFSLFCLKNPNITDASTTDVTYITRRYNRTASPCRLCFEESAP